jgi:hypothetical protein
MFQNSSSVSSSVSSSLRNAKSVASDDSIAGNAASSEGAHPGSGVKITVLPLPPLQSQGSFMQTILQNQTNNNLDGNLNNIQTTGSTTPSALARVRSKSMKKAHDAGEGPDDNLTTDRKGGPDAKDRSEDRGPPGGRRQASTTDKPNNSNIQSEARIKQDARTEAPGPPFTPEQMEKAKQDVVVITCQKLAGTVLDGWNSDKVINAVLDHVFSKATSYQAFRQMDVWAEVDKVINDFI